MIEPCHARFCAYQGVILSEEDSGSPVDGTGIPRMLHKNIPISEMNGHELGCHVSAVTSNIHIIIPPT